jgi:Rrf2 family nitric oxide-sensitive transcriptional repressor
LVECFRADNQCAITPACTLKSVFAEALEALFEVLDGYSIEDLVTNKVQLKALL